MFADSCLRRCKAWANLADSNSWCRISCAHARRNWPDHAGLMRQASARKICPAFYAVYRERSAVSGHDRPRKGEESARSALADHRHAGRLHGIVLRERFRFQQSLVSRLRPGGQAIPRQARGHEAVLCALRQRRDDPAGQSISITQTTTPQVISHYNLFRSAEIDGSAAPGYSSGQAIAAMDQLASKMPQGFSYSWTGVARRIAGWRHIAHFIWHSELWSSI